MNPPDASLPFISIVTPTLNQGRFLERCLESILKQDYVNRELIVIDGGSTDETLAIIKKYEGHINYWVSEPDDGQSDAINKGFRRASGELVAWLNADDYYLDNCLNTVASTYQAHPVAPFIFGDGVRVDEGGVQKSLFWEGKKPIFDRRALIYGLNYILQPSCFINRRCLVDINYLNPDLHYGMDTDLWIRLSALAEPVAIPAVLAASREYGETKTSSGSFARIEELRCIAEQYSDLPLTPGVLCYFLDTFHHLVEAHPEYFSESYRRDLLSFWEKSAALMQQFNAQPNGLPISKENKLVENNGQPSNGIRVWLRQISKKLKANSR